MKTNHEQPTILTGRFSYQYVSNSRFRTQRRHTSKPLSINGIFSSILNLDDIAGPLMPQYNAVKTQMYRHVPICEFQQSSSFDLGFTCFHRTEHEYYLVVCGLSPH